MAEDVAHTPPGTPRGRIPLGRRQSGYPVGELETKAPNFSPGIHARGGHVAILAEVERVGPYPVDKSPPHNTRHRSAGQAHPRTLVVGAMSLLAVRALGGFGG